MEICENLERFSQKFNRKIEILTILGKFITKYKFFGITFFQSNVSRFWVGGWNFPFPPVATPLVGISQVDISRFSIAHCLIYFASAGPKFLPKGPNWARGPKVGHPCSYVQFLCIEEKFIRVNQEARICVVMGDREFERFSV